MKSYTDPKTTPLIFHRFMRFFFFPVGMLVTLSNIFLLLPYMGTSFVALVAVPLYIVYFVASTACVLGFGKWKSYAWYALLWALGLRVVDQLLSSGLDFYSGVSSSNIASEVIGCFIANGLIFLYYYKRRGLFFQPATAQSAESVKASKSHDNADSCANKSEPLSPFRVVPPVLYAEPEAIPRKYSGSYYTFTGDTEKDVQALQSNYDHASSLIDFTMNRMDQVGNNPGNPKREELAHKFFAYQIAKSCYAHIIAAISQEAEPAAAKKLVDIQTRNVQFQFDYMCDLIRDFYMLQADLASSRNNPERQKSLEDQISALENNISDAQVQIFRIYRM